MVNRNTTFAKLRCLPPSILVFQAGKSFAEIVSREYEVRNSENVLIVSSEMNIHISPVKGLSKNKQQ